VLEPQARHQGLGIKLLSLLEAEAAALGYRYSCVWADDAVQKFYIKAGYLECEPQSISRPVLNDKPVARLERLMQTRSVKEGDVCLRKRLQERSTELAALRQNLLGQIEEELEALAHSCNLQSEWTNLDFISIPWERQVGPSCGLAALRMVASSSLVRANLSELDKLLEHAKALGASTDGEMYDINDLAKLASEALGLQVRVAPFNSQLCSSSVAPIKSTPMCVLTYDKGPGAGRPELRSGLSAHYGVLIGSARLSDRLVWIVQHGASKKLVAAFADDWLASNAQLSKRSNGGIMNLAGLCLMILQYGSEP